MKKKHSKLFTTSVVLATFLFAGCGTQSDINIQPHDTTKSLRVANLGTDWTWFVDVQADMVTKNEEIQKLDLDVNFYAGLPKDTKHFQYFLDTDNNPKTGFSGKNGWEVTGADILIEDDKIYKSQSNTAWKWKYLGQVSQKRVKDSKDLVNIKLSTTQNILKAGKFNVELEVYDKNWEGFYTTVTGIDVVPTVVDGLYPKTLKKVFQELLGESFMHYQLTKDKKGAIVVTKEGGFKTFTLYNIKNSQNPQKLYLVVAEKEGVNIQWLKVTSDTRVKYQTLEDSKKYKIIYDYKSKTQISKTEIPAIDSKSVRKQLIEQGKITKNIGFTYKLSPKNNRLISRINTATHDKFIYSLYKVSNDAKITFIKDIKGIPNFFYNGSSFTILDESKLTYKLNDWQNPTPPTTYLYNYINEVEISHEVLLQDRLDFALGVDFHKKAIFSNDFKTALTRVSDRGRTLIDVYDINDPSNVVKKYAFVYDTHIIEDIEFTSNTIVEFSLTVAKLTAISPKHGVYRYRKTDEKYMVSYDLKNNKELSRELK